MGGLFHVCGECQREAVIRILPARHCCSNAVRIVVQQNPSLRIVYSGGPVELEYDFAGILLIVG